MAPVPGLISSWRDKAFPQGKPAKALQDAMKVKVLKVKALVVQSLSHSVVSSFLRPHGL